MLIYLAGKNLDRAQSVMTMLRQAGHTISYDWVGLIDDTSDQVKKAADERQAIQSSQVVVYLWEPDQESARYEAGMAMGLNKKLIVSGKAQAHFFTLPEVIIVNNDSQIIDALEA